MHVALLSRYFGHRYDFYSSRHVPIILRMSNRKQRCFSTDEKVNVNQRFESGVSHSDPCQELVISQL